MDVVWVFAKVKGFCYVSHNNDVNIFINFDLLLIFRISFGFQSIWFFYLLQSFVMLLQLVSVQSYGRTLVIHSSVYVDVYTLSSNSHGNDLVVSSTSMI